MNKLTTLPRIQKKKKVTTLAVIVGTICTPLSKNKKVTTLTFGLLSKLLFCCLSDNCRMHTIKRTPCEATFKQKKFIKS